MTLDTFVNLALLLFLLFAIISLLNDLYKNISLFYSFFFCFALFGFFLFIFYGAHNKFFFSCKYIFGKVLIYLNQQHANGDEEEER